MEIATIGFTRTSAERFFRRLAESGAAEVWDVRLHKSSQLAGFAKRGDLDYFLQTICGLGYRDIPELAPGDDILRAYRARRLTWDDYERAYARLIAERAVERQLRPPEDGRGIVLLCSEAGPENCHRRIAAEYLQQHWEGVSIRHL
ncbi:MAG: hypothetical protein AMXMBFR80_27220 [Dehalococcoidia bacterium]